MNEHERDRTDAADVDRDVISLRPYLDTLRRYRAIIVGAIGGASVLFVIVLIARVVIFPAERVASLGFRLQFVGAGQNQYPNAMPFSPTEIIGVPVAMEVFKTNDLQKYGNYEAFKNALFLQQSNPALDMLGYRYQSLLSDPKLNAVDRARIEAEFTQERAALTDPSFSLSLRRSENFRELPDALAEKVLNDTLAVWAVQAERTGAMKYQLPILSSLVLSKESLDSEDYLVAAEQLRSTADRIISTLSALEKVPGAHTVRTLKDGVSLVEIWVNLEDALRFELDPLLGIIRSEGVTKNARQLRLYASTQVFKRQIEKQAAEERARAVQSSLAGYVVQRSAPVSSDAKRSSAAGSARPQGFDTPAPTRPFSDEFLQRLIEMSATSEKGDMEYRQKLTDQIIKENLQVIEVNKELAFYQDVLKSVQGTGNRAEGSAETLILVKAKSQAAFAAIEEGANQLVDIYNQLSAKNLNPGARLYAITGPFTRHTQGSFSYRSAALSFLLVLMLTLVATASGCLIHDAMTQRSAA
jgi:hypothetical protein